MHFNEPAQPALSPQNPRRSRWGYRQVGRGFPVASLREAKDFGAAIELQSQWGSAVHQPPPLCLALTQCRDSWLSGPKEDSRPLPQGPALGEGGRIVPHAPYSQADAPSQRPSQTLQGGWSSCRALLFQGGSGLAALQPRPPADLASSPPTVSSCRRPSRYASGPGSRVGEADSPQGRQGHSLTSPDPRDPQGQRSRRWTTAESEAQGGGGGSQTVLTPTGWRPHTRTS